MTSRKNEFLKIFKSETNGVQGGFRESQIKDNFEAADALGSCVLVTRESKYDSDREFESVVKYRRWNGLRPVASW